MLTTYRAILNGNQIIWVDKPPRQIKGVEVRITLLRKTASASKTERGQAMALALAGLAKANALTSIADPVVWQREIRQDRDLPNRAR
jgi:hypothetical protein